MKRCFGFFLMIFGLGYSAYGCQCLDFPPLYEEFDNAGAVFLGRVLSTNALKDPVELQGKDVLFEIQVLESFKGVKGQRVTLNRGSIASSCYSGYPVGETFLFYTEKNQRAGVLNETVRGGDVVYQSSFCNRSTPLKFAADQLALLKEKRSGIGESMIYGSVASVDSESGRMNWKFKDGIAILLKGKSEFTVKSDNNGLFRFDRVPPGTYDLLISPIHKFKVVSYPQEWTLTVLADGTIVRGDGSFDVDRGHRAFFWQAVVKEAN